jgi:hypothetical protein
MAIPQMNHAERAALVILDGAQAQVPVGREKLAQILKGSKARDILRFHYDKHAYYAKLAALKQNQIDEMIRQLVSLGHFKIIGGEYPVLSLTPKGEMAIQQKSAIELKMPQGFSAHKLEKKKAEMQAGGTVEYTGQLLASGLTSDQIAHQRGLTVITIYGHCAKLIEAGKLDVDKVIPEEIKEKIEKAIQKVGSTQFLFPIKSLLPDEITYEMIRCVVSGYTAPKASAPETDKNITSSSFIQHIVALGESKCSSAVPELIIALKSEDANARRLAASALGKIRNSQAVEPLMNLLSKETKPQVRQYAVKALGMIGDSRVIRLLMRISEDENEQDYTRSSAKLAILRCRENSIALEENLHPEVQYETHNSDCVIQNLQPDLITSYLSSSHPRPLKGSWHSGFALDFHSNYTGADWNRSGIGDLVYRLKYQADASTLPTLVEHTCKLFAAHPEMNQFNFILPVPSSTQRDFNPVQEFCKALSGAFNKPVQASIVKTRQTKPQKEMHTLPQKRDNVAGAFALNNDITCKSVLLVDDLFDSGATLEEITKLLLQNNAAHVNVLTLTRTIHADL